MARAWEASMREMRAWAWGECRIRTWSSPGRAMSSTNVPRPVASLTLSTLRSGLPTVFSSDLGLGILGEDSTGANPRQIDANGCEDRRKAPRAPRARLPALLLVDVVWPRRRT